MKTALAFIMVWACLLAALPASILVFAVLRRKATHLQQRVIWACVLVVLSVFASVASGVRFTNWVANITGIVLAYISFCYLVVSCWRIPNKLARFSALAVASIPIVGGYALGTVGVLVLIFLVGDEAEPPLKTEHMTANLNCEVTGWGMAGSDSGYTVHLYKSWSLLPLVEKEVAKVVVNESHPVAGIENATCKDVWTASNGL